MRRIRFNRAKSVAQLLMLKMLFGFAFGDVDEPLARFT